MVPVNVPKRSKFLSHSSISWIRPASASSDRSPRNVRGREENHTFANAAPGESCLNLGQDDGFPVLFVRKVRYSVWNCILEIVPALRLRLTRIRIRVRL